MGAVYLARELALDRLVALKVILDEKSDPSGIERFLAEARLAARLRHPNIVAIHAVGREAGVHYFTMDFVEGATLEAHVARSGGGKGLPPDEACRIATDVCRAVAHAHRSGVVHRDLKPGNVMVGPDGHVVVMDFGLAKAMDTAGVTASGIVVGTPSYVSPEQLQGRPASPASDIYAIGLVFYYVLTGTRLVQGDSMASVVAQHVSGAPASRLRSDPGIPEELRPLLLSMVRKEPEKRPRSLDDVLAALGRSAPAASTTTVLGPVVTPRETPSPVPGKRTPSSDSWKRQAREKMAGLLDKLGKREEP
jgi:serine/threonine-protein kinase